MTLRFDLGRVLITTAANETVDRSDAFLALVRHALGDWGDLCEEDRSANEEGLANGNRLLSVYSDRHGTAFWIITEWDRSVTTILLPSDYEQASGPALPCSSRSAPCRRPNGTQRGIDL